MNFPRKVSWFRDDYEFVQSLVKEVWKLWTENYLPTLMKRAKWNGEERDLKIGDVVLIVDGNLPRGKWIMGIVKEVQANQDSRVRRATVKTPTGELERPVAKLGVLEEAS